VRNCLNQQPALLTWVINTDGISLLMQQASYSPGKSERVSRDNLSWNFGLPEDGRLLAGGALPYAIEWHTDTHPATSMVDLGCRLETLEIHHPNSDWLQQALASVSALQLVHIIPLPANETPYLSAEITTPHGSVTLQSCMSSGCG
jgi:hypothetical protein